MYKAMITSEDNEEFSIGQCLILYMFYISEISVDLSHFLLTDKYKAPTHLTFFTT